MWSANRDQPCGPNYPDVQVVSDQCSGVEQGIGGFAKILNFVEKHAPLRRNVSIDEVGNTAAFLLSDLASGITGEILYVDAEFNTTTPGMEMEQA